jgi:hypothetical protein
LNVPTDGVAGQQPVQVIDRSNGLAIEAHNNVAL